MTDGTFLNVLPLNKHALEREERSGCSPKLVWSVYTSRDATQTRVKRWGNSLGVRIPRGLAEQIGLGAGTEGSLSAKDGELVVKPALPARLSLDDLLQELQTAIFTRLLIRERLTERRSSSVRCVCP